MNARLLIAALAIPCLCAAAEQAIGQDRSVYGPKNTQPGVTAAAADEEGESVRMPVLEERQRRPIEMLESWSLGDKAELGIGRFRVGEIARARTHNERVRDDLMARENRAIAGAGLRLRFP